MKKRLLSAILSFCMLLTMAPTVAFAADGDDEGNTPPATSALAAQKTAKAASHGNWRKTMRAMKILHIPWPSAARRYGGLCVGKAPWHVALSEAANRKQINQIELSSGLTHIGDNAFLQASVTDVKIPDTVISIGTNAFWNCNTIQTTIPASVQELGATAFYGTFVVNVDANSPYFYSEEDGKIL